MKTRRSVFRILLRVSHASILRCFQGCREGRALVVLHCRESVEQAVEAESRSRKAWSDDFATATKSTLTVAAYANIKDIIFLFFTILLLPVDIHLLETTKTVVATRNISLLPQLQR